MWNILQLSALACIVTAVHVDDLPQEWIDGDGQWVSGETFEWGSYAKKLAGAAVDRLSLSPIQQNGTTLFKRQGSCPTGYLPTCLDPDDCCPTTHPICCAGTSICCADGAICSGADACCLPTQTPCGEACCTATETCCGGQCCGTRSTCRDGSCVSTTAVGVESSSIRSLNSYASSLSTAYASISSAYTQLSSEHENLQADYDDTKDKNKKATIGGAVGGVLAGIILLGLVGFFAYRFAKKKYKTSPAPSEQPIDPYAPSVVPAGASIYGSTSPPPPVSPQSPHSPTPLMSQAYDGSGPYTQAGPYDPNAPPAPGVTSYGRNYV